MKKLLILLLMCLAMRCMAVQVWWVHSFSDNAVVHSNDGTLSITEYAENVLGDSLFNVAYMIKDISKGTYLNFPEPAFEDGVYDANWVEVIGNGKKKKNAQIAIGAEVDFIPDPDEPDKYLPIEDWSTLSRDWTDELEVELHLYDEENDSFTKFAVSDIFTLADIKGGLYGQGTVDHSGDVPTVFVDFYTDDYVPIVPEPSITILAILSACTILMRRRFL